MTKIINVSCKYCKADTVAYFALIKPSQEFLYFQLIVFVLMGCNTSIANISFNTYRSWNCNTSGDYYINSFQIIALLHIYDCVKNGISIDICIDMFII